MRLLNYKLDWNGSPNQSQSIPIKRFDAFIPLPGKNPAINYYALFITPHEFLGPFSAQKHLSLSFSPKYSLNIPKNVFNSYNVVNNENGPIDANSTIGDFKRVWPAFGNIGCGREAIVKPKDGNNASNIQVTENQKYPNGGAKDSFHQNYPSLNHVTVMVLTKIILYDRFLLSIVGENQDSASRVKIIEDTGFILKFQIKDLNYSISVSYNTFNDRMGLRFWAYVWKDYDGTRIRQYENTFEDVLVKGPNTINKLSNDLQKRPSGTAMGKIDNVVQNFSQWVNNHTNVKNFKEYRWPSYLDHF